MATKKTATYRTDLLDHAMNAGKEVRVRQLLSAWRKVACMHLHEQWSLFVRSGKVNKQLKSNTGSHLINAAYVQMIRYQVVGQLDSWISNRQNDFRDIVNHSSLDAGIKHQLHTINSFKAWYKPEDVVMKDGTVISNDIRRLAQHIMRHLKQRNYLPDMRRVSMMIDQRCITVDVSKRSAKFPLWARLSTLEKGKTIQMPIKTYPYFEDRKGNRALSVQIMERDGKLVFGMMTDVSNALAASRSVYTPRIESLSLDLGLVSLFATNTGDLIGRGWLNTIKGYDAKITALARYRQKHGIKVRSERYKAYVAQLRGFIRSEVNRVLNQLVAVHAPAEIIVEKLDFRSQELSKRLNRILNKFGKNEISKKLNDLHERYGITITETNAPYSSQECHSCGYVDKRNRQSQAAFVCRWCHLTMNADVNAARVHQHRRSMPLLCEGRHSRKQILSLLVRQHRERFTSARGGAADPRLTNPYFRKGL